MYTPGRARRRPVFVHLDLDVLEARRAAGAFPAKGGLDRRSSTTCSRPSSASREIVGFEVTNFQAPLDEFERTALRAIEPILTRCGSRCPLLDATQGRSPCPQLTPRRRSPVAAPARRGPARARARAREARRRAGEDREAARAREADRARAARAADRRGHVRRAGHPRPAALLAARDGRRRRARRRRRHGLRQGRRPAGRGLRLRLHGHGRVDGHDRRAEGHAPARAGAVQADPVRLAARLRRRADPGGGRARCSRARATCSARRS